MTDDLVKRLREVKDWWREPGRTAEQAADRIEQLEAALREIAGEPPKDTWDEGLYWWAVEIAEAALAGEKKDEI